MRAVKPQLRGRASWRAKFPGRLTSDLPPTAISHCRGLSGAATPSVAVSAALAAPRWHPGQPSASSDGARPRAGAGKNQGRGHGRRGRGQLARRPRPVGAARVGPHALDPSQQPAALSPAVPLLLPTRSGAGPRRAAWVRGGAYASVSRRCGQRVQCGGLHSAGLGACCRVGAAKEVAGGAAWHCQVTQVGVRRGALGSGAVEGRNLARWYEPPPGLLRRRAGPHARAFTDAARRLRPKGRARQGPRRALRRTLAAAERPNGCGAGIRGAARNVVH